MSYMEVFVSVFVATVHVASTLSGSACAFDSGAYVFEYRDAKDSGEVEVLVYVKGAELIVKSPEGETYCSGELRDSRIHVVLENGDEAPIVFVGKVARKDEATGSASDGQTSGYWRLVKKKQAK